MADVELVIKIPEVIMEYVKRNGCLSVIYTDEVAKAIKNGTPLDDVKAEIQRRADDPWNMTVGSASQGLKDAIEILDNIGETESEE